MKHTKSMVIRPTAESTELTLYAVNTAELYHRDALPIIDNLARKKARGTYDEAKAIDAFYYMAQDAAKMYAKEFAHVEDATKIFDVTARYTTAAGILEHYADMIEERAEEIANQ